MLCPDEQGNEPIGRPREREPSRRHEAARRPVVHSSVPCEMASAEGGVGTGSSLKMQP